MKSGRPLLQLHLGFDVAGVVRLERLPPLKRVRREVAGAPAVCLGGGAGLAEVADEVFSAGELAPLDMMCTTGTLQGEGKTCGSRAHHRATPARWIEIASSVEASHVVQHPRQAHPLEGRVERSFLDTGEVVKCVEYRFGDGLSAGEVDHVHGLAVDAVGEQQNLEGVVFCVAVDPASGQVGLAVGLDVYAEYTQSFLLSRRGGGQR